MAFFKQLKRAFGFSDAELEEEELEGIDARVTPLRRRQEDVDNSALNDAERMMSSGVHGHGTDETVAMADGAQSGAEAESAEKNVTESRVVPSDIFDTVVKIFNESMPEFIKMSVDEKAQKEYLYNSLNESMQRYIESLGVEAQRCCNVRWEAERKDLLMQMETLRGKAQKDEDECSESKKLQLSAERQKRALSERVHELEKQLASIEAENEQYVLENKSLLNKIRLHSVVNASDGGDVQEEMSAKILELTDSLSALQQKQAELQVAYDGVLAEKTELQSTIESLQTEKDGVEADNEKLKEALEQSKVKDDVGDVMLTDLHAKLASVQEECKAYESRLSELTNEKDCLTEKLDAACREKAEMQQEYNKLKIEKASVDEKLAEAHENLQIVEQMHEQLLVLEESRRTNDAALHRLKDESSQKDEQIKALEQEKKDYAEALNRKNETIATLEDQADGLRKTIEKNLYEHAQSESAMRAEIDRLKYAQPDLNASVGMGELQFNEEVEEYKATPKATKNRSGKSRTRTKISAIDESIEDTDWLIATPPKPKKKEARDDMAEDFGYKEPVKKTAPDNPAQMSLW